GARVVRGVPAGVRVHAPYECVHWVDATGALAAERAETAERAEKQQQDLSALSALSAVSALSGRRSARGDPVLYSAEWRTMPAVRGEPRTPAGHRGEVAPGDAIHARRAQATHDPPHTQGSPTCCTLLPCCRASRRPGRTGATASSAPVSRPDWLWWAPASVSAGSVAARPKGSRVSPTPPPAFRRP